MVITLQRKKHFIAKQNLTIQQKNSEAMQAKFDATRRELTGKALSLLKSEEVIDDLKNDIIQIIPKADLNTNHELNSLLRRLKSKEKSKELWKEFEQRFNELNDGFITKLLNKHPHLSPAEIRLCTLLRLQLSNKEISDLSKRSIRTIEHTRARIRKKIGLLQNQNITTFLLNI